MAKNISGDNLAGLLIVGVILFPIVLIYFIFKAIAYIIGFIIALCKNNKEKQQYNALVNENLEEQLRKIDNLNGWDFEKYTASLLKKIGYTKINVTSGSGDFGADIIAEKDGIRCAIQCKRFNNSVGPKVIGEVLRGMNRYECSKGIIITNNYFTNQAIKEAQISNVELWDRNKIINLIKNLDSDKISINKVRKGQDNNYITCPYCKSKINSKSAYCTICGKNLEKSKNNIDSSKYIICPHCKNKNNKKRENCWLCGKNLKDTYTEKDSFESNKTLSSEKKNNNIRLTTGEYDIPENLESGNYIIYLKSGSGYLYINRKSEEKLTLQFGNEYSYQILEYNNLKIQEGDVLLIEQNCVLEFEKVENKKADLNNIRAGVYNVPDNIDSGKYIIKLKSGSGYLYINRKSEEKLTLQFGNEYSYQILEYNNLKIQEGDVLLVEQNCVLEFIRNGDIINVNNQDINNQNDIAVEDNKTNQIDEKKDIKQSSTIKDSKGKMDAIIYIVGNIENSYYSYISLLDDLKKEGFSEEISISAIESCEIDWNNEAVKCAKVYLEYNEYSYKSLKNELLFEKFTEEQAKYGVDNCNANWDEQALKYANEMLDGVDEYTPNDLIDELESEDFEEKNIKYALKNCKINWDEQAVKTARNYRNENIYSNEDILLFLKEDDGYTTKQAQYGIKNSKI